MVATDALIIGAGPTGLFQVFQLGLQGIQAHVVEVLDQPGGQCIELYPDKPIYDIPGLPSCTGRELTQRLLQQIAPFCPKFHFNQQVSQVQRCADGRWHVATPNHQFLTRTLFIAAGVGAFLPKELKVDGLSSFLGSQLFYRVHSPGQFADKHLLIVGADDSALTHAITFAQTGTQQARSVTLLHRRDALQAHDDILGTFKALRDAGKIRFVAGQITGITTNHGLLASAVVCTPDDQPLLLPLDALLVNLGISPKLGPIANWGLAMERKQLRVNAATFSTSEAGIFAVGDINTYPGKKKLIVCGFHEATLAAFAAATFLNPQHSEVLQYTTSSALLQQRLGVIRPG